MSSSVAPFQLAYTTEPPAGFTRALVEQHPSAPEVEMDPRVVAASQERPDQAHRVITHAAGTGW